MSTTRRQARAYCRRHPQRDIKPIHIAAALGVTKRYLPEITMTGEEVLAAVEAPPAWLATARERYEEALAKRKEARAERAATRSWTAAELEAEYTLTGLKEGLSYEDAAVRGRAAARTAVHSLGLEKAGQLVAAAGVARARHIADLHNS